MRIFGRGLALTLILAVLAGALGSWIGARYLVRAQQPPSLRASGPLGRSVISEGQRLVDQHDWDIVTDRVAKPA